MPLFQKIPCKKADLRIDITLVCGQSFRWREVQPKIWRGVILNKIITLTQTDSHLLYHVHQGTSYTEDPREAQLKVKAVAKRKQKGVKPVKKESKDDVFTEEQVRDYFQLNTDLQELYLQWSKTDENFKSVAKVLPGVRILRQDPVENLFSFICSSNNNISRITGMVEKLCLHYGDYLDTVDGEKWYSFPQVSRLAGTKVEAKLRSLGFGYRAKFINQTAGMIHNGLGEGWLQGLRLKSYEEAHQELLKLPGVGAKVADCVCLFSLDKPGAIPVDTHVWQIASRDYLPHLKKTKSLTDKTYKEIGEFFRLRFGSHAGWAHSVLFSADLKKFQVSNITEQAPGKEMETERKSKTKMEKPSKKQKAK